MTNLYEPPPQIKEFSWPWARWLYGFWKKFNDLASTATDDGASLIGQPPLHATEFLQTVSDINNGEPVSIFRFIDTSLHSAVRDNTITSDVSADFNEAQVAVNAANGGTITIPAGTYPISTSTVDLLARVVMRGETMQGVRIDGSNLSSGPIFRVTGGVSNFLHGAGLYDMLILNGPSHGLHVDSTVGGGVGECFFMDRVQSSANGGHGFMFEGDSTPVHLGRLSAHSNTLSGLYLKETRGHVQVQYIAGDNNLTSLVEIDSINSETSVNIVGWKSERWGATPGHPDIFKLTNCLGGYVHIGPGRYSGRVAAVPNAIVNIDSGTSIFIDIEPISTESGITADYTYGVENSIISSNITPTQLVRKGYCTVNKKFYPASAGAQSASIAFQNEVSIGGTDSGNELRLNHSGDGADASSSALGVYTGATRNLYISNVGTVTIDKGVLILNTSIIRSGSGSPEGAVQGDPGDLFMRTDGGAGTCLYVKESGASTTGWVAK